MSCMAISLILCGVMLDKCLLDLKHTYGTCANSQQAIESIPITKANH